MRPANFILAYPNSGSFSDGPVRRKVEDLYGNSFAAHVKKSGFLKELWGSDLAPSRSLFSTYRGYPELPVLVIVIFFC